MLADTIKLNDKIGLIEEISPYVMQYLAANSSDQELITDDIIDFFALSIAAVIDDDTDLTTLNICEKPVRQPASISRTGFDC